MPRQKVLVTGFAAVLALALACSKQSSAPTSPSVTAPAASDAAADGSTLKVPAPTLVSPLNDVKLDDVPTLTASTVTAKYATGACTLQYEFQLFDPSGAAVSDDTVSTPTDTISKQLAFEVRHTWRARAACLTSNPKTYGPWSAVGSFISSSGGYIKGNEVYDPLINGKTVGQIHGAVTFIPNVGVRLETQDSWITYPLPTPDTTGEFSLIATGIGVVNTIEDPKNSIMSMSRPDGSAFNDNLFRMSVDVRGNGDIAWRFLTGPGDYIETVGAERQKYNFHEANTYFFKATWNGVFNVEVRDGGFSGPTIYSFGKPYSRSYNPNPVAAYVGRPWTPGTRDSPASWQGAIVRQVWLSQNNPRPASANK